MPIGWGMMFIFTCFVELFLESVFGFFLGGAFAGVTGSYQIRTIFKHICLMHI